LSSDEKAMKVRASEPCPLWWH